MNTYMVNDIGELIKDNSYVGRGIVIGLTPDEKKVALAYFIMGRSEHSRNRIFELRQGELFTRAFDESKLEDPSLIIYAPMRSYKDSLVVTNGDQTDTIVEFLEKGKSFEEALATRKFEPDYPNFTPRISAIVNFGKTSKDLRYKMSILKSGDEEGLTCNRYTFDYEPKAGLGHFIHTYEKDGNPIPTFKGEPERVAIESDIDQFTTKLWDSLNQDNKISLYVRFIDLTTREYEERLINKNK